MNGTLVERLAAAQRIHLDSAAIIYFIERHSIYAPILRPVFNRMNQGDCMGISSYVTLIEVLTQPLREARSDLVGQYKHTLLHNPNLTLFPLDVDTAETAAQVRSAYGWRTPDAIQLATAWLHRADAFVTNDKKLKRFSPVEVLVLEDFR